MTITYSGTRSYDPSSSRVSYLACVDGVDVECGIDESFLMGYFEDMGDPLSTFDSGRLVILDFTKEMIRGEASSLDGKMWVEGRTP